MKKRVDGLEVAAKVAHIVNHLSDIVVVICLLATLIYSVFGIWDNYQIYVDASIDRDILKYKPDGGTSNPTLSELQKINPDVCAWLTVDGTNIDYPVVQGEDNLEYVNRDVYGEYSLSGSVFLDYRNERDFSDFFSLVYAHHMEGNVMFGEITNFLEKDYFDKHTSGTLYLPDGTYQIEWFCCISTNSFDNKIYRPKKANDETFANKVLSYLKQSAIQYRELGVTTSDKIIGLSTCDSTSTDGRTVLFGRMSKNG
jgi:sortase B